MDPIRPIAPLDRDLDPILRVERAGRDRDRDAEREQRRRRQQSEEAAEVQPSTDEGEDDDGRPHIDVRV
jgi:hypothetical protein